MSENTFVVDFIASECSGNVWKMVIIEEGDWSGEISSYLHRIQGRFYECIDAALDGQLAEQFPESKGKDIVIQLDCYDAPKEDVLEFFDKFSGMAMSLPDYHNALKNSEFVKSINFEINF
jgi:hypothetical protein